MELEVSNDLQNIDVTLNQPWQIRQPALDECSMFSWKSDF